MMTVDLASTTMITLAATDLGARSHGDPDGGRSRYRWHGIIDLNSDESRPSLFIDALF